MSRSEIAKALLAAIALGVMLLTATAASLHSADVPAWVIRGIAAVETGTDWREIGDVRGAWKRGAIGEVGPWQLSPAVLADMRVSSKRERAHRCPVLAESLTRAWLTRLYNVTGSWPEACAAYHAGLAGRSRQYALDYAERVQAAGLR